MSNTFTAQRLASGQLASTPTALYTVPSSTTAYIKFLSLVNTSSTLTETIIISINDGTAAREIAHIVLAPLQNARVIDKDEALNLNSGDVILGSSTDATTVDYILSGILET